MSNLFENLQKKSDSQKKNIFIISILILMILVVFIWFFQIKNYSVDFVEKDDKQLAPINDLKEEIIDIYRDTTDDFKELKEYLN